MARDGKGQRTAGGWGALRSTARVVLRSGAPLGTIRSLRRVNQERGFDCPGCAWPDPARRSAFEFCENGVKAVAAETTGRRVTRVFFAQHTVTELLARSDHWLEDQGRLTEPMRYDAASDRYVPVTWDEACERIGEVLRGLASPDEAALYTSGRTSNEAAFLWQLFGRLLGTNNFPDCSNMCHESSGVALKASIGVAKGTVTLEDFERADAIFILGQNPGSNHPRMLSALAAAARRGARIVTLNPLVEPGLSAFIHPQDAGAMLAGRATAISTHYLQVKVGGDLAALKGLAKAVLEAEARAPGTVLDHAFLREHVAGLQPFQADIEATTWEAIEAASGLTRELLREAAQVYTEARAVIACWAMGLTQHLHAVATIQAVVNLLLLRGNLGRPGAGACPVRGHSNVQGDRTMGITEAPAPEFLDALERRFGFRAPRRHGLDTVGTLKAMADGRVKVLLAMGGNFARATPDTASTEAALRRCALTAHVTTKLNRSHLVHGTEAYLLPCLGRSERDEQAAGLQSVTVEDSMSMVHASTGALEPASPQLRSEPAIVAGLARAALPASPVDFAALVADYRLLRQAIADVLPAFAGFEQRLGVPGGFHLRNSAREREWAVPGGKARLCVAPIPARDLAEGGLWLTTIRSHDQYNTTIYSLDDRYRGVRGSREVLFLGPAEMAARGLAAGDRVVITSLFADGVERRLEGFAVVPYDLPAGCAAAYFPETNVLVSVDSFAEGSRTPTSKSIPVRVERRESRA